MRGPSHTNYQCFWDHILAAAVVTPSGLLLWWREVAGNSINVFRVLQQAVVCKQCATVPSTTGTQEHLAFNMKRVTKNLTNVWSWSCTWALQLRTTSESKPLLLSVVIQKVTHAFISFGLDYNNSLSSCLTPQFDTTQIPCGSALDSCSCDRVHISPVLASVSCSEFCCVLIYSAKKVKT